MVSGLRYRVVSVTGTVVAAVLGVIVGNLPIVQSTVTTFVPLVRRLSPTVLVGDGLLIALATTILVVTASFIPLFKPRPRRLLDTILLVQKRVVLAGFALATIGYANYTYRLPRATLGVAVATMLVVLPTWFVAIRRRPVGGERAIVIGDDPEEIRDVLQAAEVPIVGYVSPPSPYYSERPRIGKPAVTDGSGDAAVDNLDCLGGLSRLDEVLVKYDVDTAILSFAQPDRVEFFGALDTCYEHGVSAKVHRDHTDDVLTSSTSGNEKIVDVDLEPWDWQDYVVKRAFDVGFSLVGLVAFAPFIVVIAVGIKLDSPGPVFYSQERTAELGDTFKVYKFRSMVPEGESVVPIDDEENDRITRVGHILRRTHLDEIPQLWSILAGEMSVVGPRAVWTDEERLLEESTKLWRKRWFVKPGLTGLAQIQDVKSTSPEEKLRYDLEYIRRQSFWLDFKIVIRQIWSVLIDASRIVLH